MRRQSLYYNKQGPHSSLRRPPSPVARLDARPPAAQAHSATSKSPWSICVHRRERVSIGEPFTQTTGRASRDARPAVKRERRERAPTHVRRLLGLLVLAVLDRVVEVAQDDADRVLVRHVERKELDHVEVVDLRDGRAVRPAGSGRGRGGEGREEGRGSVSSVRERGGTGEVRGGRTRCTSALLSWWNLGLSSWLTDVRSSSGSGSRNLWTVRCQRGTLLVLDPRWQQSCRGTPTRPEEASRLTGRPPFSACPRAGRGPSCS